MNPGGGLAIGIPLALLLLLLLVALEQWGDQLPLPAPAVGRTSILALEHRHQADHRPVAAAALKLRPPAGGVAPETPQSIRDGGAD